MNRRYYYEHKKRGYVLRAELAKPDVTQYYEFFFQLEKPIKAEFCSEHRSKLEQLIRKSSFVSKLAQSAHLGSSEADCLAILTAACEDSTTFVQAPTFPRMQHANAAINELFETEQQFSDKIRVLVNNRTLIERALSEFGYSNPKQIGNLNSIFADLFDNLHVMNHFSDQLLTFEGDNLISQLLAFQEHFNEKRGIYKDYIHKYWEFFNAKRNYFELIGDREDGRKEFISYLEMLVMAPNKRVALYPDLFAKTLKSVGVVDEQEAAKHTGQTAAEFLTFINGI